MILIEDSRQQKNKHEIKHAWWAEHGVRLIRCKLVVGDYALMPSLSKIIDTKASIAEIAQNCCNEHDRFTREVKLARDIGTTLYILVENEDGIEAIDDLIGISDVRSDSNPNKPYTRPIPGSQLAKSMHTYEKRYGCVFMFCRPEEAAETIIDLLR